MIYVFIIGNLRHPRKPSVLHWFMPASEVCAPGPALLCDMHTESQCGGNRGHSFPKDRLAARAINYKRQGDRHQASLADRQTDRQTVPQLAQQAGQEQARQIQRGEEELHVVYDQERENNPPLVASRLRLSAPVLLSLLPLDSE